MESQLVRPNGGHQQEHKLSPEEGEQQQQQQQGQGHDKISVLKKVKAKARKLKETIAAKHAHMHEQGQRHDRHDDLPDDHDLDEEEDEVDEEMVTDPEVHAPQINEPITVAAGAGLRRGEPGQVKNQREEVGFAPATTPYSESSAPGIHRVPDRTIENFLGTSGAEEDPLSPTRRTDPPNCQIKVSDPTGLGSKEADVSPLIQSIGKMTIEAEPESGAERDRISSNKTESDDQFSPETIMKYIPAKDESEKRVSENSYTERISSVTAAVVDKTTRAKDVVASKLGFAPKDDYSNAETGIKDHANAPAQGEETSERPPIKGIAAIVTEKLSPVYEKVVETGSAVVSKVRGGGGATDGKMDESSRVDTAKGKDKGVSVKEYMAEKLKPGEEDKALSEVISETARSKGVAGAVGGAFGYLLGKSGQPSPQPQASSGSGRPDKGEHQSEDVAEKSEVDLDMGKGA